LFAGIPEEALVVNINFSNVRLECSESSSGLPIY